MKAARFAHHLLRNPNAAMAVMALIDAEVAADRESMHLRLEAVDGYPDTTAEAHEITELARLINAAAGEQPATDRGETDGLDGLTLRVVSDPHGEEQPGWRITAGLVANAEVAELHDLNSEVVDAIRRQAPHHLEVGEGISELLVPASAIGGLELLAEALACGGTGAPPAAVAELVTLASKLEVTDLELDGHVHDVASRAASSANNEGIEGQIAYLVERLGVDETRRLLEQDIARPGRLRTE